MTKKSRRDAYQVARDGLRRLVDEAANGNEPAATVTLPLSDAAAVLYGYPPDPEPLQRIADFAASYVPFLRHAKKPIEHHRSWGITVTPAGNGAILSSTDGRIMLLAYDQTARVSAEGMRIVLPQAAIDACMPKTAGGLWFEGDYVEASPPPPWEIAGRVLMLNSVALVMPLAQPPGTEEHNGGALFAASIATSSHHRESDVRTGEPVQWWRAIQALKSDAPPARIILHSAFLSAAAAATNERGCEGPWQLYQFGRSVVMLNSNRPDLAIVLMSCKEEEPAFLPDWAFNEPVANPTLAWVDRSEFDGRELQRDGYPVGVVAKVLFPERTMWEVGFFQDGQLHEVFIDGTRRVHSLEEAENALIRLAGTTPGSPVPGGPNAAPITIGEVVRSVLPVDPESDIGSDNIRSRSA